MPSKQVLLLGAQIAIKALLPNNATGLPEENGFASRAIKNLNLSPKAHSQNVGGVVDSNSDPLCCVPCATELR